MDDEKSATGRRSETPSAVNVRKREPLTDDQKKAGVVVRPVDFGRREVVLVEMDFVGFELSVRLP